MIESLAKRGLRVGTLTATGLSCAAAWIKVFSVHKDRFWVVLLGQTVLAFSFLCILQSPPVVAAVWFGAEEISTACSIGVFGSLIGVAVGYILPSVMVVKDNDEDAIAKNLFILSLTVAALNTAIFIIELIFFGDKPPSPPSGSQSRRIEIPLEWKTLAASYMNLLKNSTYLGLMTLFAIDYGVQNSYFVCLNQMLLLYYPDASVESGRVGALIIVSGIISIAANGVLLDKFHQFKSHFLVLQVLGAVAMVGFTHTLGQPVYIIYLLSVLLGILWMPTVPTCIEAMVESTYPESEGLVIANAYLVGSLSSTIGIFAFSALIEYLSALWANYVMIFLYLFGLLVLICTNFRKRNILTDATLFAEISCQRTDKTLLSNGRDMSVIGAVGTLIVASFFSIGVFCVLIVMYPPFSIKLVSNSGIEKKQEPRSLCAVCNMVQQRRRELLQCHCL
ncbi:feline leukemia virus subgroup C receptor-related protein 2-like [Photinus pyralis]|uniref:feline leukemia virus subgroup C receptor-related protein 2-like n=1 Tax=Photinus pyralis TaxID=7054 RepID=UPI00126714C6|nr:feline leukemia virus subgroup C receptor-related protein 2-like [Photinus pyralis]